MQLVIRTDSSRQIGTGHVMRCLNLADYLAAAGHAVSFICRDLDGNIADLVSQRGYHVTLLPHEQGDVGSDLFHAHWLETSQAIDAQQTIAACEDVAVDWVIIDHYALDAAWEAAVNQALGCKCWVIDDLVDRAHECDILLDQNYYNDGGSAYNDLLRDGCQRYIGPRYALLKPDFFQIKPMPAANPPQRLFIFFGGMDSTSETLKALRALQQSDDQLSHVDVVCGARNPDLDEITQICEAQGYALHINTPDMAQLIAQADIGLGAGGVNTWERCFLQLPTLVISVAENQEAIAQHCDEAGFVHYLGKSSDVTADSLASALADFATNTQQLENMRASLSDYFTTHRLADVIQSL